MSESMKEYDGLDDEKGAGGAGNMNIPESLSQFRKSIAERISERIAALATESNETTETAADEVLRKLREGRDNVKKELQRQIAEGVNKVSPGNLVRLTDWILEIQQQNQYTLFAHKIRFEELYEEIASLRRQLDGAREVSFDPERRMLTIGAKSFKLPVPIYKGVYQNGSAYSSGEMVSRDGSVWVCLAEITTDRPGSGNGAWRLAVKGVERERKRI